MKLCLIVNTTQKRKERQEESSAEVRDGWRRSRHGNIQALDVSAAYFSCVFQIFLGEKMRKN